MCHLFVPRSISQHLILFITFLLFLTREIESHFRGHSNDNSSPGLRELVRDIDCYIEDLSLNQSQNGVAEHASHSSYLQQQSRLRKGYISSSRRRQKLKVCYITAFYILFHYNQFVQQLMTPFRPLGDHCRPRHKRKFINPAISVLAKVKLTISLCFLE